MIIYGWNNRVIKESSFDKLACPHCKNESAKIKVVGFYFHIFWIPLFPYKKKLFYECDHCKEAVEEAIFADQFKEVLGKLRQSVRFPKYMFSGSGLLLALIVALFINADQREKTEIEYLKNPQVGDIYHLKDNDETTEFKYYLWKAEEIFEDSLYITANAYNYDGIPEVLLAEDGFFETLYVVDKKSLMELYEEREMVKVQRKYAEKSGFSRKISAQADSLQLTNN